MKFEGGPNISMKIPGDKFDETIHFYRDILLLEVEEISSEHPTVRQSVIVRFGHNILWLDRVDHLKESQIWLEIQASGRPDPLPYLASNGIETEDEIEQIPSHLHWIRDPAGTVLLLTPKTEP